MKPELQQWCVCIETLDDNFTMSESLRRYFIGKIHDLVTNKDMEKGGNPQNSPREYSSVIEEEMWQNTYLG